MTNRNNRNTFLVGAAVAAGLIGTLSSLLIPKKVKKGWVEQAKDIANHVTEDWNARPHTKEKNLFLGGLAGSLVGVTTALLLAPKAGFDLIKDLSRSFQKAADHAVKSTSKTVKNAKKVARTAVTKQRAAASSQTAKKTSTAKKAPIVKKLSKATAKAQAKVKAKPVKKAKETKKHVDAKAHGHASGAHHTGQTHSTHHSTHHHSEKAE